MPKTCFFCCLAGTKSCQVATATMTEALNGSHAQQGSGVPHAGGRLLPDSPQLQHAVFSKHSWSFSCAGRTTAKKLPGVAKEAISLKPCQDMSHTQR